MCPHCYLFMEENWFEMPCSRPHILVWAKQPSYPYWPAKLMRCNSDKKTVDIWYFGGNHTRAVLGEKDCLLYSEKSPKATKYQDKNSFDEAKKVNLLFTFNNAKIDSLNLRVDILIIRQQ